MNTRITTTLAALTLSCSIPALAQQGTDIGMSSLASADAPASLGALGDTSFGASQYRTQYAVTDLLSAVAEDIASELNTFLGKRLEREQETLETASQQQSIDAANAS